MPSDDAELQRALTQAQARLAELEAWQASLQPVEQRARAVLAAVSTRRKRAQQRGVETWDEPQRGALRMFVLAVGCVTLGTGAWALDASLGGASVCLSLGALWWESLR